MAILLDQNVPLHDIAAWVGHKGIRTTLEYGSDYEEMERTAQVMDRVVTEAKTGTQTAGF